MPVIEPVLQQRREWHNSELSKRPTGRRDTKRDGAFLGWGLSADRAEDRSESGGRHADTTQYISGRQHHAFGRKRDHEHADDIGGATGGDRPCCTKAIGDVADERRQSAHQEHRQCVGEGPYLAPNAKVGSDRLLENAETLARANADREDQGSADDWDPEAAL